MRKFLFVISIMIIFTIIPSSAYALESESDYTLNIDDKTADELFNLDKDDISDPLNWMSSRETYMLLEESDNKNVYWFNVPNLQTVIHNKATSFLPSGYIGSGSIPHERNDTAMIQLPKQENANTAMQKYGFRIPSPAYVGEHPRVTLSIMGVLIESNPIEFIANKISGFFGGSIISAPDMEDYETLEYIAPSDYKPNDNTFENWASMYWDDVIAHMDSGQVIISGADDEGKKGGTQFVKETVIEDNNIETIDESAHQLNEKLKSLLGSDYQNVVSNIVAYGVEEDVAKSFDNSPTRIMPYDKSSMRDTDADSMISDPRADYQTSISLFGYEINLGVDNIVKNTFFKIPMATAGFMSELTVFLNGITTFSAAENLGFDIKSLWQSNIMQILAVMLMAGLVILLASHIIKILKGDKSIGKALLDSLMSFLILGVLFSMYIDTEKTYDIVKNVSSTFMNFGTTTLEFTDTASELMGDGDRAEKADTAYWIPYFSLWTNYNTSRDLADNVLKIDEDANKPEQKNMKLPKLGENGSIDLWNAKLADSFTSGSYIDKDAYRTVDHLMAPRISVGESPDLFSSKKNENYNNIPIQNSFDIGIFLLIFILLGGMVIKVILFLEFLYYLIMFPVNLAMSTFSKDRLKITGKEFVAAFARVGIWDLALSMIIHLSMILSGLVTIVISILLIYGFYKGIKALAYSRSVLAPKSLKAAKLLG